MPRAYAIYSPTISNRVDLIRQDVSAARQLNGVGTISNAMDKVLAVDKTRRKEYVATGIPAKAGIAFAKVIGEDILELLKNLPNSALDPIFMIFNLVPSSGWEYISVCLRNDIWYLQDLKDIVGQEMIKAYLLFDNINGDQLSEDYEYLKEQIKYLKKYGNHPQQTMHLGMVSMTSSEYFFGYPSELNSYVDSFPSEERKKQIQDAEQCKNVCKIVICLPQDSESDCENKCEDTCDIGTEITWSGCPEGEFLPAFKRVIESAKNLKVAFTFKSSNWGSIWEMAKVRAKKRADEWIKANQITLTLAGEEGGNPQSLLKGGGWDKFVGEFNTQMRIVKNMVGPLVPLFSWSLYATTFEAIGVGFGADEDILANNEYCMYFYDDGMFRSCTPDQLLDYRVCVDKDSTAEDKKNIPCDRYQSAKQTTTSLQMIQGQQIKAAEYQKKVETAETAFVYNMELNNVGEQNIQAIEQAMVSINTEIQRSNEERGNNDDYGLPTLYAKLKVLYDKHCANKPK